MKKYVIQMRKNSWSKEWVVRSEHDTLAEARDELKKIPIQTGYRMRAWCSDSTAAFQTAHAGSIPAARSTAGVT